MQRIIALLLIIIFSPLFLVVSLLIYFEDGSPIIFRQKRVGINYTIFTMYKFRSMKKDTLDVATHLLENPVKYLTKIGKFIRKLSIDELPNLLNILKGDMGFVGPRPAMLNQEDLIKMRIKAGIEKLLPGLTGWAQINGRDELSLEDKVAFEKEYLGKKSIWFDLKIIFLTFSKLFFKTRVSH